MNERIKELAAQVASQPDMFGLYHFGIEELERFAELIVRECAGIYEAIDNGNEVAGTEDYLTALHNIYLGDKK